MPNPIDFPATTRNLGLPMLFAGQAQKEFFVNEAFTLVDAFAHHAVAATLTEPPPNAGEGECYLIGTPAQGDWSGHEEAVAVRAAGTWHFIPPAEGMALYDRAAMHWLSYRAGWIGLAAPVVPTGGTVIDTEARGALAALIAALQSLGVLRPASP